MKLSQSTLPQYFSVADSTSSWYTKPTNTFDFVDRNSKILVVTIGDSWTWGSDMEKNTCSVAGTDYAITDQQKKINNYRLDNLYGNCIAQELNADWLNLAIGACSNFWIAERIEELGTVVPQLEYHRIIVIAIFSPVGRWFNTRYDQYIDYVGWFNNNIHEQQDFDKLFSMLNNECVSSILQSLDRFSHVQLLIGTTWADHCGFEQLSSDQVMLQPWYELLDCGRSPPTYFCHYHERLSQATEFMAPELHDMFKHWFLDTVDATARRLDLLKDPAKFYNAHPNAQGHQTWAHYILKNLT